jgi:hypothetical protein
MGGGGVHGHVGLTRRPPLTFSKHEQMSEFLV